MPSIWNRMFGTVRAPEPNESFSFGLGFKSKEYQFTLGLHVLPFRKTGRPLCLECARVLPRAAAPVQFGTTQLGITFLQRDPVA